MTRGASLHSELILLAACLSVWNLVCCASPYADSPGRWKRQSCSGFKCRSGECIDAASRCDGIVNCPDKSDETTATCLDFAETCPAYSVRCDYGACVDSDARCNNKEECADGSDEKGCKAPPVKTCSVDQFQCDDGSCVRSDMLCDGKRDCKDGSDETEVQCKSVSCPSFSFMCSYGACVDMTQHCDGVEHCADGSDEWKSLCNNKPTSPRPPPSSSCPQPTDLQNGEFVRSRETVTYSCNKNFHLIGTKVSKCQSGVWPEPPSCTECGHRSNSFGGATFVLKGEEAQYEEFPWSVAIYDEKYDDDFELICGGTLVSLRMVITAAHCFWDDSLSRVYEGKKYSVVAGKFYRDWAVKESGIQRLKIENITVYFKYIGAARHYSNDISVVTLTQDVKFTRAVRPACIDWNSSAQPKDGQSGIVSGWGYNELQRLPDKLMKANLIVRDFKSCLESVPDSFIPYLTDDKFCAGHRNGTGVCKGDSGSGLIFANPLNGAWYLWGIVSIGVPKENKICSQQHYTTFVNIYKYIPWLKSIYK